MSEDRRDRCMRSAGQLMTCSLGAREKERERQLPNTMNMRLGHAGSLPHTRWK
jgi:hypothetical protein